MRDVYWQLKETTQTERDRQQEIWSHFLILAEEPTIRGHLTF